MRREEGNLFKKEFSRSSFDKEDSRKRRWCNKKKKENTIAFNCKFFLLSFSCCILFRNIFPVKCYIYEKGVLNIKIEITGA